ncbi:cilia- and flagella-associated protein 47-like [Anguilla rostrata]|uniref:cilia- and flagella-associated protein 47-like n=1 Tax=Anguilla rostrata TaxID=7938 RepID=UPI0030CB23C0
MAAKVVGVRIYPPVVEFIDVKAGEVYKTTLTVTNTGKSNRRMRLHGPISKLFRLRVVNPDTPIAAGLSFTATVEYAPEKEENTADRLVLVSDHDVIEIPLRVYCPACSLRMDSLVDFGSVVANSQIISKDVELTNQGSAPGAFEILYQGDTPLSITPSSGVVAPGGTELVRVELCADQPQRVCEEATVKLQGSSDSVLRICVEVVQQALELLDPSREVKLSCLRFGPTYFGTSRLERVVLVNRGPEPSDWVALLQDDAVGTEAGTDLQKNTCVELLDRDRRGDAALGDFSAVLTCVPSEGRLEPNQRALLSVCFSPADDRALKDKGSSVHPPKRDFSLFMKFEIVGSKEGFIQQLSRTTLPCNGSAELAVTGSALPLSLSVSPSYSYDFQQCMMGERVDFLCVLHNRSALLPVAFRFRKTANFATDPSSGHISPGQCQDVVLSFVPHQMGVFRVKHVLEVLGQVAHLDRAAAQLHLQSFHHAALQLSAACAASSASVTRNAGSGFTRAVTTETGRSESVWAGELDTCVGGVHLAAPGAAMMRSLRGSQNPGQSQCVTMKYRTTAQPYSYVDPDFAFTEEEEGQRKQHKERYLHFIRALRQSRLQRARDRKLAAAQGEVNIGIPPAAGLVPPRLSLQDMELDQSDGRGLARRTGLLTTCALAAMETRAASRLVTEGMNAVPSSAEETADCGKALSAQQLYQVVIGPSAVDFGEVCAQSVSARQLSVANGLRAHVWVQVEVGCPELQRSSPLSHVLPPLSSTTVPLIFESATLGSFSRCVSYTVNRKHSGHVVVQAEVVPVALELSASEVVLCPTHGLLAQSGYRGSVTLSNRRNHPAHFTWKPIITDRGIAFSVRPATGTVEAYRELDCEVVWHPSFYSPLEGQFDLCVHQGNTARLQCVAKVGSCSVQLAEKHMLLGSVPLNFTTIRTTVLRNTGHNHAYFQVFDVYPLPGMVVTPSEGVVPVGGQAEIQIHFTPEAVVKFDTRVEIGVKSSKSLELRLGGFVEPPLVDISVKSFQFHGVHSGSTRAVPFTLQNLSSSPACVQFDLSEHKDFAVEFPQGTGTRLESHLYKITLEGLETVECSLIFSPKQVAAYDFNLPVTLNSIGAPSPPPSSVPKTPSFRDRHIVTPRPQAVTVVTPSRRVQATALRPPLEMSQSSVHFEINPVEGSATAVKIQTLELRNSSQEEVRWRFAWRAPAHGAEEGEFAVSPETGVLRAEQSVCITITFSPASPGCLSVTLPLFLWEETLHPYRLLSLSARVHAPTISFLPARVILAPVPLDTPASATLTLLPSGYTRGSWLRVELEEVVLEDGGRVQPFSVVLPQGGAVPAQSAGSSEPLTCSVTFRSQQPLSVASLITFSDRDGNRFQVEVCATADNCLLTVWPYLAVHRSDQQIILKSGHLSGESGQTQLIGEAMLRPCPSRDSLSRSTTSSSTFAMLSSVRGETPSNSEVESGSECGPQRKEQPDVPERMGALGLPCFPPEDSEESCFCQAVLQAAQNWFSQFGWPRGPHPITLPQGLRRAVCKMLAPDPGQKKAYQVHHGKDTKTVYDMLLHLSGQVLPGLSSSQSLPRSLPKRAEQLRRQHATLLSFLSAQGACLSHIRPEYLLDQQEYNHWQSLPDQQKNGAVGPVSLDDMAFESLSKRAWTDVLLQTYKVLVLPRVTEVNLENLPDWESFGHIPRINPDPLASNIYSTWERRLLTWLNLHYHKMRSVVWNPSVCKGDVPPARWIVNFDLDLVDGLVLAAVLAAHCPFLIPTHFQRMYTSPSSLEQNLHNNIILSQSLQLLRLDIDIQATDLSDPNPIQLLMLCLHLYERLPQYLPKRTITLSGSLHCTFTKQLRLKNPSTRTLLYHASILGQESPHFSLPHGPTVSIPPNSLYLCLFLCLQGFGRCRSPCYQLAETKLKVVNPFSEDARFRVSMLESKENLTQACDKEGGPTDLIQRITSAGSPDQHCGDNQPNERMETNAGDGAAGAISEFFSPLKNVCLKTGGFDFLEIQYLPFHQGKRYCFILLLNEQVGDMVYLVDGTADLPLPSPLISEPSPNLVHLSSSVTVGTGRQKAALRFRCSAGGGGLRERVRVPLVNEAWERALVAVATRGMSPLELERRWRTGTVDSSTVRAGVAAAGLTATQTQVMEYSVEVSMPEHFLLPDTISLPVGSEGGDSQLCSDGEGVWVPLQFRPGSEGRYRCQVALRSWQDVRVHALEVTVRGEELQAELEFTAPAHTSVTQDIPLNTETLKDCRLRGLLPVWGFSAPPVVYVRAGQRLSYPVTFHPTAKCVVMGRLSLVNEADGTEYSFGVRGLGERPRAQDHVQIHCAVHAVAQARLQVPNYSQSTVMCKVVSDLSIVSGPPTLEIKPGHCVPYTISVSPWKRGIHKGEISFVAAERAAPAMGRNSICTPDQLLRDPEYQGEKIWPYEVWFSLEVICSPAPPVKVMTVRCAVHSSVTVEIPVTNPGAEPVQLQVFVEGPDLSGDVSIGVPGQETLSYLARFAPATVGRKSGSVVFQSEVLGEFWYQLDLMADPLAPTTLPDCSCELGKWTRISLPLWNPTDETLELDVLNSNPQNFALEPGTGHELTVEPHSSTQVLVRFSPSALGRGNHTARVCFTCPQLGEWVFLLSGTGVAPGSMESLSVASRVGSHSSLILPFRNPMEDEVVLHVFLTDEEQSLSTLHPSVLGQSHECMTKAFSIPLRKTQGIALAPEAILDVPVVFTPDSMQRYSAWVVILMEPRNGQSWSSDRLGEQEGRATSEWGGEGAELTDNQQDRSLGVAAERASPRAIRWVYPVHGIPEAVLGPSHPDVIRCQARCRVEERLDVQLTGCVPGPSAAPVAREQAGGERSVAPAGPGSRSMQEDFLYEIRFEKEEGRAQLEHCVALSLLGCERDPQSGIVTLSFSIVFAPCKPTRCAAEVAVQCITGGLWKFPIMLISTEPQVDDVINIEAAGLNKTSGVGFRLTSQSRYPEPFTARLLPGSGPEFQVTPQSGELLPVGSPGTLLTVTFTPSMYSKRHQATLLVQTADMQWTYEVNGVLPVYTPPSPLSVKAKGSNKLRPSGARQQDVLQQNFQLPAAAAK